MKYKVGDEVLVKAEIMNNDVRGCKQLKIKDIGGCLYAWVEEKELRSVDKTYEQGLSDAWELAKKIVLSEKQGGFSYEQLKEMFGVGDCRFALTNCTAEEALAKIEAYEREKEINVGDVVKLVNVNGKGVVLNVVSDLVRILWADGVSGSYKKGCIEKTDKHIDIESLLRQIGE